RNVSGWLNEFRLRPDDLPHRRSPRWGAHNSPRDPYGPSEDVGLNGNGLNGPADLRGYKRRRHARIGDDYRIVLSDDHRLIDDHGLAYVKDGLRRRQDDDRQGRRNDVWRADEQPKVRLVLDRDVDFLGRHRRPADHLFAPTPGNPRRAPLRAGHPDPA